MLKELHEKINGICLLILAGIAIDIVCAIAIIVAIK